MYNFVSFSMKPEFYFVQYIFVHRIKQLEMQSFRARRELHQQNVATVTVACFLGNVQFSKLDMAWCTFWIEFQLKPLQYLHFLIINGHVQNQCDEKSATGCDTNL